MTEQPDDQPPAVESAARSRRWQRTAGAAAVVAVLVVGNATAANATSADATATHATRADPSARSSGPHQSSESPRTQASAALHGEFRVVNRDGSAQLRRWQSGAVDAIDSMSLTVRSADGYDSTYLLGPGVSVTGIGVGDEVTVVGAGQAVSGNS
jgi:hypothetical protein